MKTFYPVIIVSALITTASFARDSFKTPPARTGQGAGIYEVVRNWPKYPEGKKLGNLHGDMAADSKGRVYIATGGTIQVISADGTYVGELRAKNGNKAFRGVHGMKVRRIGDKETLIIAMPGVKRVVNVGLDGTVVWQIIGPPKVEGMYGKISQYNPTDVDVAADGTVYIVDGYGKSLVHVYDKDRKYLKTFGGKGKEDGKFNICHNILIDNRTDKPTLLISDRQNNRLQLHDMDGTFIRTIDSKLGRPCAADIYGELLAVSELDGRVSLYDKDNELISRLGDEPKNRKKAGNGVGPADWHEGALIAVHGCTFDAKGDLYAQEWNVHGRVTKYTRVK